MWSTNEKDSHCNQSITSLTKYEHFINDVLKTDLKRVHNQYQLICQQLAQYLQIKQTIKAIKDNHLIVTDDKCIEPLKLQTDLGSNFYVQTVVPKADKIYLMIGLGFYVELTLEEALDLIDKKEKIFNQELIHLSAQSSKIKANIKLVIHTIDQITSL
ncbi:protein UXT-like [Oppia nitens]|uniref:protein UXT-like n=1 Tax=Oppia nitens TaxID=1686743 RepID=UPI0023DB2202|nr:protein UXT-like [Oppia nitens]